MGCKTNVAFKNTTARTLHILLKGLKAHFSNRKIYSKVEVLRYLPLGLGHYLCMKT